MDNSDYKRRIDLACDILHNVECSMSLREHQYAVSEAISALEDDNVLLEIKEKELK